MKKILNMYFAILTLIISITLFIFSLYNYNLSKVSSKNELLEVEINKGSISSVAKQLKENNLIKSELAFKIYVYTTGKTNLKAAIYKLSENMGTKKIVNILSSNNGKNISDIKVTFNEGLNMRDISQIIEKNTNNKKEDVENLLNDKEYLNKIINKYWFLNDTILNGNIYYSLEGYLYPNTYSFASKDVKVEDIFEKMLDEEEKQLSKYKKELEESKNSIHEIITLASIVELEGNTTDDRKNIAGVFYNRLNSGMSLGSDVTTYYGIKVNMSERNLKTEEINECNNYNTRCQTFKTLPISPICNPSIDAISATLKYEQNKYYYFVADKNKKVYFSKNSNEHSQTINSLKKKGLWYEYK